jgi:hypothetical protein
LYNDVCHREEVVIQYFCVESEFSASSWIYVFWTIWCLQGKVLVEAKKDEKVEIPDEETIDNKHVTAGPTYYNL